MTQNQDEVKAFSFKILIHEVKLQSKDKIILQSPQISVSLSTFPRLVVKGECSISTINQKMKAFRHGKSALIQITSTKMKEILANDPLELLLLNEGKILGGSRLNLKAFIEDLETDKQLRFRRGTFHLLDQLGQPYALTDVSICIHPYVPPQKVERQQLISQKPSQVSQSLISENEDPMPDQSSNEGRQKYSDRENNKEMNHILVQENKQAPIRPPQYRQPYNRQQVIKKENKRRVSFSERNLAPAIQTFGYEHRQPATVQVQKQPEPDISIMDWVNGYHCPPPLILDKKIYYHEMQETKPQQFRLQQQTSSFGMMMYPDKFSIGVQTEGQYSVQQEPRLYHTKSAASQNFEGSREKTNQSDEYLEDFESIEQSQLLLQSNVIRKQVSSISLVSSQGQASPKIAHQLSKKQRSLPFQGGEIDEQISEIYSDDFDSMSQSASKSMKKSQKQFDEISESYAQDFESMSHSQYTNSTQKLQKRK